MERLDVTCSVAFMNTLLLGYLIDTSETNHYNREVKTKLSGERNGQQQSEKRKTRPIQPNPKPTG